MKCFLAKPYIRKAEIVEVNEESAKFILTVLRTFWLSAVGEIIDTEFVILHGRNIYKKAVTPRVEV